MRNQHSLICWILFPGFLASHLRIFLASISRISSPYWNSSSEESRRVFSTSLGLPFFLISMFTVFVLGFSLQLRILYKTRQINKTNVVFVLVKLCYFIMISGIQSINQLYVYCIPTNNAKKILTILIWILSQLIYW